MAETFQDLKVKLIEHYRRVQSADELTAGFNLLVDGEELRQLIGGLKRLFRKSLLSVTNIPCILPMR